MSVIACVETFEGRSGNQQLEKFTRKYTRTYNVRVNSVADTAVTVLGALLLPPLGSAFPGDPLAICINRSARSDSSTQYIWRVQCEYSSEAPDPDKQDENPLLRPTEFKISTEKQKEGIDADINGNKLVNSAGDPFLPPIERDGTLIKLTATKNLAIAAFNSATALEYVDKVNDDTWQGFPPFSVKLESVEASQKWESNMTFWATTWNFSVKMTREDDAWIGGWSPIRILDQGYHELVDGERRAISEQLGRAKSTPTLLDGNGAVLPEEDDPVFLEFELYEQKDFDTLPL